MGRVLEEEKMEEREGKGEYLYAFELHILPHPEPQLPRPQLPDERAVGRMR